MYTCVHLAPSQGPEEGIRVPETKLRDGCELSQPGNSSPLQEQPVLVPTVPSLQALFLWFLWMAFLLLVASWFLPPP